jgi:Uncharacterized conserved protein (DUF2183)
MKNLLILWSLIFSLNTFASVSIISDLDDTIKITNSGNEVDGTISAAFKSVVFTGIPEFFLATKDYANEMHVLSASPIMLRAKIEATLKKRQIAYTSLILKNAQNHETKFDYKVKAIKMLMENNPDDFVLIGDDVGQDPEAYAEIQRLYPNRILAIYIHVIKNRAIPAGTKYWTSFDLFLREFAAARMNPGWVEHASRTLLAEKDLKKIIPDFADCPKNTGTWAWQTDVWVGDEVPAVLKMVSSYCQARNSSILALQK